MFCHIVNLSHPVASSAVLSMAVALLLLMHCLMLLPFLWVFCGVRSLFSFAITSLELLYFCYVLNVMWLLSFFDSSSRYHGMVFSM